MKKEFRTISNTISSSNKKGTKVKMLKNRKSSDESEKRRSLKTGGMIDAIK
jgi:hypothetical protein